MAIDHRDIGLAFGAIGGVALLVGVALGAVRNGGGNGPRFPRVMGYAGLVGILGYLAAMMALSWYLEAKSGPEQPRTT